MVADLEQRAFEALLGKHPLLNRSLRIAFEQYRGATYATCSTSESLLLGSAPGS